MITLKEVNVQILAIQKYIEENSLTEEEYLSLQDMLVFYLDTKSLLVLQNCKGELPNDLSN